MPTQSTHHRPLNVAVTGGGTGGHVMPLVSFLEYVTTSTHLKEKCNHIYWVGASLSMEEEQAKAFDDVIFLPILSGKLRRYLGEGAWRKNIRDFFFVLFGVVQGVWYIWKYRIDVVFGKGGYVSFPLCIAAWLLRKKVILHESDMHPGLANRLLFPFATEIFTGFPLERKRTTHVGQLLSLQFLSAGGDAGDQDAERVTHVLVLGGSQGARSIFDALLIYFAQEISTTPLEELFCFHITLGTKNDHYAELFAPYSDFVKTYTFLPLSDMVALYRIGDIAITRGGATSLAEQKLFGIVSGIIPLPFTGGNHQYHNACWYRDTYGDTLIPQDDLMVFGIRQFLDTHIGYKKSLQDVSPARLMETYERVTQAVFSV